MGTTQLKHILQVRGSSRHIVFDHSTDVSQYFYLYHYTVLNLIFPLAAEASGCLETISTYFDADGNFNVNDAIKDTEVHELLLFYWGSDSSLLAEGSTQMASWTADMSLLINCSEISHWPTAMSLKASTTLILPIAILRLFFIILSYSSYPQLSLPSFAYLSPSSTILPIFDHGTRKTSRYFPACPSNGGYLAHQLYPGTDCLMDALRDENHWLRLREHQQRSLEDLPTFSRQVRRIWQAS